METGKKNLVNVDRLKKFKELLDVTYVKQELNKGLSTLDFNQEYVDKINSKADASVVDKVQNIENTINENKANWDKKVEYAEATTSKEGLMSAIDKTKLDSLKLISNISELTNDSNYQTAEEVQRAIAIAGHMTKKLVESLPPTGEDNVLYLVKKVEGEGTESNVYNEYLWINNKFELIGDTDTKVDLSGYIKQSDITICSDQDIANLFLQ